MIKRGLDATMNANDVLTALPSGAIERKGRWRSFRRSLSIAVVLGLLALPPALVACGGLEPIDSTSTTMPPFEASALIALTLLIGMALTLLVSIYRCWELVDTSRGPAVLSGLATAVLLFGGAAWLAHVVCDLLLWLQIQESITPAPILVLDHWFWISLTCLGSGLVVILGLAMVSSPGFWWRRGEAPKSLKQRHVARLVPRRLRSWLKNEWHPEDVRYWQGVVRGSREPMPRVTTGGTIICCSGGGIRSASFCLGGMQELQQAGEYRKAAAVVGVSGGGYIATAMHILRWRSGMESGGAGWRPLTSEPFAPGAEEFQWLRRHTRYLFDNLRMGTLAALTVVFGMAVNLFWCTAALGALAWWAGWLFLASGGLEDYWTTTAAASAYRGDWSLLNRVWVLPLIGVGLFVLERIVNRVGTLPAPIREAWRTAAVVTLWFGLVLVALLLGLPWLMATVHNSEFFGRGPLGDLVRAVGLRNDDPASLAKTASGSLAAIAAAVLAIVRLGVSKIPDKATANKASQLLTRVTTLLKHVLLPWAALAVIATSALILLMSWIARFHAEPAQLADSQLVMWFAGLAVAIKFLTDTNWTSLHHFYRERLTYAFIQVRGGDGHSQPISYRRVLRFSESRPPEDKPGKEWGPRLIACAVANISDQEFVPADRRGTPFVFDDTRIGLTDRAFPARARRMDAATYEFAADPWFRAATLPAAMAMSGAAFSPLVGREQRRVAPFRFIMALANARLGVWLPNPLWTDAAREVIRMVKLRRKGAASAWAALSEEDVYYVTHRKLDDRDRAWLTDQCAPDLPAWFVEEFADHRDAPSKVVTWHHRRRVVIEAVRWIFNQPGGYRVAKEAIGKTSVMDRRLYITDGGHYDNTGLVEALRRRPDRIIVLDASNDPPNSFRALGEAVATARMDLGCEVDIDPTPMVADRSGQAKRGWVSGTARCDDGKEIEVHFIKAVPTTSMPLDTQVYASRHPEFPRTSTGNQFYGEFDLEAYRQLGIEATKSWLRSIDSPAANGAALSRGNGAVTGVALKRTRSPRSAPAR